MFQKKSLADVKMKSYDSFLVKQILNKMHVCTTNIMTYLCPNSILLSTYPETNKDGKTTIIDGVDNTAIAFA